MNSIPSISNRISEQKFQRSIKKSLETVKTILDNTRNPCIVSADKSHTYDDKFGLAIFLCHSAIMSICNGFMGLGLDQASFRQLIQHVKDKNKSVTLRFKIQGKSADFIEQKVVKVENGTEVVVDESSSLFQSKTSRKVITNVTHYHWQYKVQYIMYAYVGNDDNFDSNDGIILHHRTIDKQVIPTVKSNPVVPSSKNETFDVSLSWLLQQLDTETLSSEFTIDRTAEDCRTPRQNQQIYDAYKTFRDIHTWCSSVKDQFINIQKEIYSLGVGVGIGQESVIETFNLSTLNGNDIFVPVLPLFERIEGHHDTMMEDNEVEDDLTSTKIVSSSTSLSSSILSTDDMNKFLKEQCKQISENSNSLTFKFTSSSNSSESLMTPTEALHVLICSHTSMIIKIWTNSVDYIEEMLRTQLERAIGKIVQRKDLDEFVHFHNQRLFSDKYKPAPFCYTIRRPGQYPDGLLSIESLNGGKGDGTDTEFGHAMTHIRKIENEKDISKPHSIFIPIDAATSVEFQGDIFLHGWVLHKFQSCSPFQIAARTRQFSSFLLIIGKVSGKDKFDPQHAIILQNKDEVLIPLLMEEMSSKKEFRDAIESMSPEQQDFAKAFRSMKLASSVFGLCVVQLKPQLERLLGLPEKALTKEIRLTQDLLTLFIKYQIPSDLITFDGTDEMTSTEKVDIVKKYVENVNTMILDTKKSELEEEGMKSDMAVEGMIQQSKGVYEFRAGGMGSPFCESLGARSFRPRTAMKKSAPSPATIQQCIQQPFMSTKCHEEESHEEFLNYDKDDSCNYAHVDQTCSTHKDNETMIDEDDEDIQIPDFTTLPEKLDSSFEKLCSDEKYDGAIRSTTLKSGKRWEKKTQATLLSSLSSCNLYTANQKDEKKKAFDLLDALSRSGSLPISCAELHIIVATSHCFEKSVVDTVILNNVNPIGKLERTHLMVASNIHDTNIENLLQDKNNSKRIRSQY